MGETACRLDDGFIETENLDFAQAINSWRESERKRTKKRKHILQRYEWCVENQIMFHWLLTLQQSEKDLFFRDFR